MNITDLPYEVLVNIFSYLPNPPTKHESLVCKLFEAVSKDHVLWKEWAVRFERITSIPPQHLGETSWKTYQIYIKQVIEYLYAVCTVRGNVSFNSFRDNIEWLERANIERDRYVLDYFTSILPRDEFLDTVYSAIYPFLGGMRIREKAAFCRKWIRENDISVVEVKKIMEIKGTFLPIEFFEIGLHLTVKIDGVMLNLRDRKRILEIPLFFPASRLDHINNLSLKNLYFRAVPEGIRCMNNLTVLDLSQNNLYELPKWIYALKKLEELVLHSNRIQNIHDDVSYLKELNVLDLRHNQLEDLPDRICELNNLRTILLHANKFTSFPEQLFQMPFLDLIGMEYIASNDDRISSISLNYRKIEFLKKHRLIMGRDINDLMTSCLLRERLPRALTLGLLGAGLHHVIDKSSIGESIFISTIPAMM